MVVVRTSPDNNFHPIQLQKVARSKETDPSHHLDARTCSVVVVPRKDPPQLLDWGIQLQYQKVAHLKLPSEAFWAGVILGQSMPVHTTTIFVFLRFTHSFEWPAGCKSFSARNRSLQVKFQNLPCDDDSPQPQLDIFSVGFTLPTTRPPTLDRVRRPLCRGDRLDPSRTEIVA